MSKQSIEHRGKDPEAIQVAEHYGLSFDGMQDYLYQFTVRRGPAAARNITFYIRNLSDAAVLRRLKEKYVQFGVPYYPKGGQAAHLLSHPRTLKTLARSQKR